MGLFPLGLISQGGGGNGGGAFELISTTISDGSIQSVTFSSISSTYKHLQLRITANANLATRYHKITFNGSATGYRDHKLYGNGSSVTSTDSTPSADAGVAVTTLNDVPSSTNHFGAVIMDILDYGNTNKNKTVRALSGAASAVNQIMLSSDLWANTVAITSLTVLS